MFIDTSAIVAILLGEPEAARLADAIAGAPRRFTSPLVRLETCVVLSTRLDIAPAVANRLFDEFLGETRTVVSPVSDEIGSLAVAAFEAHGKGRGGGAKLNLADCMSYACAKFLRTPILFVGRDFAKTDIDAARY